VTTDTADPTLLQPDRGWKGGKGLKCAPVIAESRGIVHPYRMSDDCIPRQGPIMTAKTGSRIGEIPLPSVRIVVSSDRKRGEAKSRDDHHHPDTMFPSLIPM
jgi:hypothetical protein